MYKETGLIELPPNRVRRNYLGGKILDEMAGSAEAADGERPENWVCSLTEAKNPGMDIVEDEGLSPVIMDGARVLLKDVIAENPRFYLGEKHFEKHGLELGFLTKLLDSSMRLHLQAHPTREYARRVYNKPYGKFEAYVILASREDSESYIYLGFQNPPTHEEWVDIVTTQDKEAMLNCFEKVPVKPGEVWYVPGGCPHAIGGGLTVLEIMEPSDLVVRCEFEREGIIVPEGARFMGLEPEEALRIFHYDKNSLEDVKTQYRVDPEMLEENSRYSLELLISENQIDCFEVRKLSLREDATVPLDERFAIAVVGGGAGSVSNGDIELPVKRGSTFMAAAGTDSLSVRKEDENILEIYLILPGKL